MCVGVLKWLALLLLLLCRCLPPAGRPVCLISSSGFQVGARLGSASSKYAHLVVAPKWGQTPVHSVDQFKNCTVLHSLTYSPPHSGHWLAIVIHMDYK